MLEFINKYVVLINSLILLILVVKYLQDLFRSQRESQKLKIEYEKLKLELDTLRTQQEENKRLVVQASSEQISKYVIEPLSREINRAAKELGGTIEAFKSELSVNESPANSSKELREIGAQVRDIAQMTNEITRVIAELRKGKLMINFD